MSPRRRPAPTVPASRTVLIPPREHCWIESDAYDRSAFAGLVADAPSLAALIEAGSPLLPHFRELLEDVFCLLFKLEPRFRTPETVAAATVRGMRLAGSIGNRPAVVEARSEIEP